MDIRTYDADSDVDAEQMTHLDAYAAENARLTHELDLRIRQIMDVSRNYGQLLAANKELRDNAAELGKALDMCIAERDAAYRELDAQTLKANSFRSELHRYIAHADELKEMLDTSVAERDALRDKLADAETRARLASDLLQGVTEDLAHERQQRRELERQLDAMREAMTLYASRMAAMGC